MKFLIDGETVEFDTERITNVEGMAIERVTGMLFGEWGELLNKGSMLAITALVWIIRKRQDPPLRFDDVLFEQFEPLEDAPAGDASDPAEAVLDRAVEAVPSTPTG